MALKNYCKFPLRPLRAVWLCLPLLALAQNSGYLKVGELPKVSGKRGAAVQAKIPIVIQPGYHVNSNTPSETYLIPLRYFLVIVRGVFLKDMPVAEVAANIVPLCVIALFTLTAAAIPAEKRRAVRARVCLPVLPEIRVVVVRADALQPRRHQREDEGGNDLERDAAAGIHSSPPFVAPGRERLCVCCSRQQ